MAITKDEVNHIAKLARMTLSDTEEESTTKELDSILGYISQLNTVNTKEVEPLSQVTGIVNSFRPDEEDILLHGATGEELVGQAPHRKGNYVKVKTVIRK